MAVQSVFSNFLDPSTPNLSDRFKGATAFFIEASLINAEFEIDCYLQVYLPSITGEVVRNIALGKIIEQSILLNIADTEIVSLIGKEFIDTDYEMALLFLASSNTFLRAAIIKPDYSLAQLDQKVNQIEQQLNVITNLLNLLNPANQLEQLVLLNLI